MRVRISFVLLSLALVITGCTNPVVPDPTSPPAIENITPAPSSEEETSAPTSYEIDNETPSPEDPVPTASLTEQETERIALLFQILTSYMRDGDPDKSLDYEADKREPDDFYSSIIYFYLYHNEAFASALGSDAFSIRTGEEGYLLNIDELTTLYKSFFGDAHVQELPSMFEYYAQETGDYVMQFSDGPGLPTVKEILNTHINGNQLEISLTIASIGEMDAPETLWQYAATLEKNPDSLFGYSLLHYSCVREEN